MIVDCSWGWLRLRSRRMPASILLAGLLFLATPQFATADDTDDSFNHAFELRKKGKLEEARRELEASLRLNPDHNKSKRLMGLICFQIGEKHQKRGKIPQALEAFQEAVKTDPEEAYWHAALSRAMNKSGDSKNAVKECAEAVQLSPLDALLQAGCQPPEAVAKILSNNNGPPKLVQILLDPKRKNEPPQSGKAQQIHHQVVATLDVLIDAQGNVSRMAVVKPSGFGLDQEALKTVSTWKFKPAKLNGVPVAARTIVEVEFRLY